MIKAQSKPLPFRVREVLDSLLPLDPLSKVHGSLPSIEVAIPCTAKDILLLETVVRSVIRSSHNSIEQVTIIVPSKQIEVFKEYLEQNLSQFSIVLLDEEVLLGNFFSLCQEVAPNHRQGWLIQQVVKFFSVLTSNHDQVLVLDSDTVLCSQRTWVKENKKQLLMISHEYHAPYQQHYERFVREVSGVHSPVGLGVSFVTHHQLMQKEFLIQMFGGRDSWREGLRTWIAQIDFNDDSPACEYHCYGSYLYTNWKEFSTLGRWGNRGIGRNDLQLEDFRSIDFTSYEKRQIISISQHSYM